ncbi:MAG: redoxin domain-containing protein [Caldiserica bacterium]|nr:redoxin domain-containing protein [Caldisericota bacterium]
MEIGKKAPEFKLKDHNGNELKLSDFLGKKVLLSFHPLAWTGVCSQQMKSLEDNYESFTKLNTVPLGFSIDTVPSKKAWAKSLEIEKTSLVCDFWPHGGYAKELGIFRDGDGFTERANIIIDEKGIVFWAKIYPIPELPDIKEVLEALK